MTWGRAGIIFILMAKYLDSKLDATFSALADPTRRAILARLTQESLSVGDLAEPIDMTWPSVTKHLKVLERARLIRRERDGRIHRMHLETQPLQEAQTWIEEHRALWKHRFDALEELLRETTTKPPAKRGRRS